MKAHISVQELSLLDIDDSKDAKIIYPSLLDVCGQTREDLDRLTDVLYRNKIFNFSNTGMYAGMDNRTNMHFTFDDGQPGVLWLRSLIEIIADYNRITGESIKIHITKKDIIDQGIFNMSNLMLEDINKSRLNDSIADEYIGLYVDAFRHLLHKCGSPDLLVTRIEPIKDSKYKIVYKKNRFIINTCARRK